MFGLWYLSLAIDELRKYWGLSSIFDVFNGTKTASNKAIEDKKPSNSATDNSKSQVPQSKPITKPAPEPPKPVVEPPRPVVQPKPVVEPQRPAPEPPKPIVAPPKPIVEPSKPAPTPVTPPKSSSPPKALAPAKQITPPPSVTPPTDIPKREPPQTPSPKPTPSPSANARNDLNNTDRNMFAPLKKFENGDAAINDLKSNIKDATTSFLQEEGRPGINQVSKQQSPVQSSNIKKNSDTMVDAAVLQKLETGFAKLAASDSKSLLKRHLSKEVFDKLKNLKTPTFGSSLLDCIQSGVENLDSGFGIYAPDAEAYSTFSEVFDPMIEDYHTGFKKTDKHPAKEFGDVSAFDVNLDPTGEYVVSTRVRCGRSMEGYPFNPCLTEAQYKEMEQKVSTTLSGLEGELKGKFYPLTGMEKAVQQQLIDDHFLFKEGDRFLQAANACRYWPSGRGIYHNDAKTFLVWCNEEDHLRIISMQMGGDLGQVYRRLVTAVNDIEKRIPFSHHDRLGFLTFCPTNLGTTIRASVHIKVPKLAANKAKLEEVATKYNLQVRGTRGEHTEAEGGIYDISNKRRMGLTEFQAVKEMYDGISEIIKLEKSL